MIRLVSRRANKLLVRDKVMRFRGKRRLLRASSDGNGVEAPRLRLRFSQFTCRAKVRQKNSSSSSLRTSFLFFITARDVFFSLLLLLRADG